LGDPLAAKRGEKVFESEAGAFASAGFYFAFAAPNLVIPIGEGTGKRHRKLRPKKLLRVTSKLAMLPFGNDIWRQLKAALRLGCWSFAYVQM